MAEIWFIADVPPGAAMSTEPAHSAKWRDFLAATTSSRPPAKDESRIAEGCWRFDAGGALSRLHTLTSAAQLHEVSFRVFLVEGSVTELTKPELRAASAKPLRM